MAWGVKQVRFDDGSKVKIGNTVLETLHSAIIRDYTKTARDFNMSCEPEDKIIIFGLDNFSASGWVLI